MKMNQLFIMISVLNIPYELSKKLPVSNYKFVEKFDKNKYGQDKDYGLYYVM